MDLSCTSDGTPERRLYIGNIDQRISEATLIRLFSPYGKIESEDFLWHTRGPKRGEPRGFAFIQYSTKEKLDRSWIIRTVDILQGQFLTPFNKVRLQEARLAKEKMHGRIACGRPLVVRLACEKLLVEAAVNSSKSTGEANKSAFSGNTSRQLSRTAKVAAIKNKLKALEEDDSSISKKQKQKQQQ